jgi:renalase
MKSPKQTTSVAVIGAGMAGMACARTLVQAGHRVTVFEKSRGFGGRMAHRRSEFGGFDHGAQYFTVRDERFRTAMQWALDSSPEIARPWGANAVRVLDDHGRTVEAALPKREVHWVAQPGMSALVAHMATSAPAAMQCLLMQRVERIESVKGGYTVHAVDDNTQSKAHGKSKAFAGFDAVVFAVPSVQAAALLGDNHLQEAWLSQIEAVSVDPCWTLMLAFPNAAPTSPNAPERPLGPQWSAARSTHHRISWLARENSKPQHTGVERWTVQASAAWSREHLEDDAERVKAKLTKAFAEITGIRAEPPHAQVHRWRYAKTDKPLGQSHLWDATTRIGVCGDWCLGHRVEDAFLSGLELALAMK